MNKGTAIKRFIFLGVFLVLGAVLCFAQFDVPFTHYTYNGFANSIKLGLDLKGGVVAVYSATSLDGDETDFDSKLNATKQRITDLITAEYSEALVSIQQGTRIRVEVPDVSDPQEVFDLIGEPAKLEFKSEDSESAEAKLTGEDIADVFANYDQTQSEWGVSIKFTAAGSQKFYELTKAQEGQQIFIYLNGSKYSAPTVNETIAGGSTFISGSMEDQKAAEDFALKIMSGTFAVNLSLLENDVVSATLGDDAIKYGLIAGLIGLIFLFAFLIWRYKMMGAMASVALAFYVILIIFFLQAIPIVQLTLAGIAGIILSIGMAVDANIIVFERIKEEFASGKRISQSMNTGFKKALPAILDSNITTIIVSIILAIFGTGSIQGFAITLIIGVALSMFTALVVSHGLLKMYNAINPNNANHYGLKRGDDVNELI